ncbi:MAG: hypothetical protein F6K17_05750 [Okeania sp. SIO3C4]|nr:hypothetical protein [Okeania sp. SIO3C4]
MSNRRRPQLKQEVNSKISRYVTFYVGFMKQISIADAQISEVEEMLTQLKQE